jgi:hypothetical protein
LIEAIVYNFSYNIVGKQIFWISIFCLLVLRCYLFGFSILLYYMPILIIILGVFYW